VSEDSAKEASSSPLEKAASTGIARRKLIRAGLAAAPVMLALKSQSALATGTSTGEHMTCSAWASVTAAKGCHNSHTAKHVAKTCHSYTYWKDRDDNECKKYFHEHTSTKHVPFFGSDCNKSTNAGTFVPTLKEVCKGKFIQPVITNVRYTMWGTPITETSYPAVTTGDPRKDLLAKHCAAMHLNATVDRNCPLSTDHIKQIWGSCKNGGSWVPPSGGKPWSRDECIDYFEYVCNGTEPKSWLSTTCT
jgi:hypothetical protein